MSYSFAITAASKEEALAKVTVELEKVVANQPIHASDKDAAEMTANAFINLLQEPTADQQIAVNMYGSLGWAHAENPPTAFLSGNISVSVSLAKK